MQENYSKEDAKSIKIGFIAIFLVSFCYACCIGNKHYSLDKTAAHYIVYSRFGRTDGLLIGDKVRMAGIDIGKVIKARLDKDYNAILMLEVKDGINIPDDSSASIVSDGLLGKKYIEIEPGGSEEYIQNNGEFSYTQDAIVLDEILDRIISLGKSKTKNGDNK